MAFLRAALGVAFLCFAAWLLSSDKRRFPWRIVFFGLVLQFAVAGLILETAGGRTLFQELADFFQELMRKADPGARLVFGPLADTKVMESVFGPGAGYVFGFTASGLLAVIFFATLMAILYHLGVMQIVIWVLARIMTFTLGISGAEAMSIAADIFVGNTEAPLVVKPYISGMTRSELFAMMTGGLATIAGTVLAVYIGFLGAELGAHLLTASVMSAPAAVLVAKIVLPETERPVTAGWIPLRIERSAVNLLEAAANGAQDGVKLALNIAGMLIAFMALVNLVDWPLGWLGEELGMEAQLSLSRMFGWVFAPIAWCLGVEGWHDSQIVGSLLGTKLAVNEFVAYSEMRLVLQGFEGRATFEHARSAAIAAYALCGFANFASVGIVIGGVSQLVPDRKPDLARLGLRAMAAGALATCMTGAIAGVFL